MGNIDKNLQRNNVAQQAEGYCTSYFSTLRRTSNSATSLLHVLKLKTSLKYLGIRRTIVWGVKIGQVYCKFFHNKTYKKAKKSHIDFSLPLINKSSLNLPV